VKYGHNHHGNNEAAMLLPFTQMADKIDLALNALDSRRHSVVASVNRCRGCVSAEHFQRDYPDNKSERHSKDTAINLGKIRKIPVTATAPRINAIETGRK
jgi:hypothetical protein